MWGVPVLLGVRIVLALLTEVYAVVLVHSLERRRPEADTPAGVGEWRPAGDSATPT